MSTLTQRSFSSGELTPSLHARTDFYKYANGLKTCRNATVMKHGGVKNRPGTSFVAAAKHGDKPTRLIPFVFNDEQTYILEFGHEYIRVYKEGERVGVFEVSTPYDEDDIFNLKYVQSADVLTLVHANYKPMELKRLGETTWELDEIVFKPTSNYPTLISTTIGKTGSETLRYKVTAVSEDGFEESLPGLAASSIVYINAITLAAPIVIGSTLTANVENGDEIYIRNVNGTTELNNRTFTVANKTATTFELEGTNGTNYTPYISGGVTEKNFVEITAGNTLLSEDPHILTWSKVSGAREYNIYKENNGRYGLIGVSSVNEYNDIGVDPDTNDTPPVASTPFIDEEDYPSTVTYIQQRLAFGRGEKVTMSRTAKFKNFTTSNPIKDDDAVTFSMVGRQVNQVKHMLDIGKLVILTSGGEWSAGGDASGTIKPLSVNLKQHTYNGSSDLQPIVVNGTALYVQSRGSIIRDLGFDYTIDGYTGNDITIFSSHLFKDNTIVDWTYQQSPESIVWAVRDDGILLGLTFNRAHEVIAWHRHDFQGEKVKSVSVVPEGSEDFLYLVIERTINGTTYQFIERMNTRKITDNKNYIFMDCARSYDGRNTVEGLWVKLSSAGGWTYEDTLTLSHQTGAIGADIGDRIDIEYEGEIIRCEVVAYNPGTYGDLDSTYDVKAHKTVPESMRDEEIETWTKAIKTWLGASHLEGEDLSVFADGFVVANPNNDSYEKVTVSGGSVTFDKAYGVIHAGLPYTTDIETLDIDNPQGETMADKHINITGATLHIEDSRGIWVGTKDPGEEDYLEGLEEIKIRNDEDYDEPVGLKTGKVDINIRGEWNNNGRVFIRQVDPLPMSILAISPAGDIPLR